jgi:hypothetical protein
MRTLRLTDEQWTALQNKHRKPYGSAVPVRPEPKAQADKWPLVLRDQIVAAGLPEPYREFTFHSTRGWRLDLAWVLPALPPSEGGRFAVEVDGAVHRIKGRFQADIEKHNELTIAGWRWIRVTPRMVETGEALDLVKRLMT